MQIVQASHGECLFCPQSGTMEVSSPEWSIILCPSCAGELKAVLPDAPDWLKLFVAARDEALTAVVELQHTLTRRADAAAQLLEAAQRLVEAAGHLQEET